MPSKGPPPKDRPKPPNPSAPPTTKGKGDLDAALAGLWKTIGRLENMEGREKREATLPLAGFRPHSDSIEEISSALCNAQSTFGPLEMTGKHGKFGDYATLPDIHKSTRESLNANDLSLTVLMIPTGDGGMSVRVMLIHSSGQWLASEIPLARSSSAVGQSRGSEITYATRQALDGILCVAGQPDDNGEQSAKDSAQGAPVRQETISRKKQEVEDLQLKDLYEKGKAAKLWDHGFGFNTWCSENFEGSLPRQLTVAQWKAALLQVQVADMEEQAEERF